MRHTKSISRFPSLAQNNTGPIESLALLLLQTFFFSYDNIGPVTQNLSKLFAKTPGDLLDETEI